MFNGSRRPWNVKLRNIHDPLLPRGEGEGGAKCKEGHGKKLFQSILLLFNIKTKTPEFKLFNLRTMGLTLPLNGHNRKKSIFWRLPYFSYPVLIKYLVGGLCFLFDNIPIRIKHFLQKINWRLNILSDLKLLTKNNRRLNLRYSDAVEY